jgi:hypothetical protein
MSFDLTRWEGQIVRPPVAAAVFDPHDRRGDAAEVSLRMPIAMGPRRPERMGTNLAVPLESPHLVPPPAVKQIENLPGRIPALTPHLRGLQPPAPRLPPPPDR